ncbi:hypothetical protein OL548_19650 [Lysinibacillus sp. MHQ-1]|nr:hypothetical protein OL548_19650 [Lysinibacillus sp. MHQ-1]
MQPTIVEPPFNKQSAQKYVKKKLDEALHEALWELWYVDADKLSALTCMSKKMVGG